MFTPSLYISTDSLISLFTPTVVYTMKFNRPYAVGAASRLATAVYVAMVTPILYDNSYSPNDSNLKYESYQPYS